ncbi:MAG: TatD family hydrolase [Magnetococcales bacterium]|nr:TatD family hydrolase [Magnetococcales bacterium]
MPMIDTHCHLDHPVFDADRAAVLARSRQAGVVQWVVPAIRLDNFTAVVALRSPALQIALGLHPLFMADHPDGAVAQLAHWVEQVQPLAIGEIGLDAMAPVATHPAQRLLFAAQVDLARQVHLPILLHVRKTHDAILAVLRQMAFPYGGIVHAFNGTVQQAQGYLGLGFRLGMGGVVTRERAVRIRQVASVVPEEALVLESDAPDLPPTGHHGERNEPCHLPLVVHALAELRQVAPEHIRAITRANTRMVLGWPDKEE